MKKIYKELDKNKIQMNMNKNPIKMDLFLSFFTVEVLRSSEDFLGKANGWTLHVGENNLKITGGWVNGTEYLQRIEYRKNLDNPYNNFVNPFQVFDILNDEGKKFFIEYYRSDINSIINEEKEKKRKLQDKMNEINEKLEDLNAILD